MPTDSEVDHVARQAIDKYMFSVTYPVIWARDDGTLETLGTSVLFRHGKRHFILTTRHLFDEFDQRTHTRFPYEGLVGPVNLQKIPPRELGALFVHSIEGSTAGFLDIVAIELHDAGFVEQLKTLWAFITVEDFAAPDSKAAYFVSGFPRERQKQFGENIGASLMSLVTEEVDEVPDTINAYDPHYDLVLKYDPETYDSYNQNAPIKSPFVGGVSGGPAFRINAVHDVWSAKRGTRFVGLQSSSIRSNLWLRVKNVHAIAKYFDTAIPEIGVDIRKHLAL